MSEININAALITAAAAALSSLSISNIAYEGRDFTPPAANTKWAAVFNLPASSPPSSLGEGGQDEHLGILQIDLNYPLNGGTQPHLAAADSIGTAFKAGTRFTYMGQCVLVRSCERGRIRNEDGWLRLSISITWVALTTR
jgi:hypothetical protein